MHITSVADDDGPFPWHMTVQNPAGILLRDVLATITQTFNQYIAEEEFLRWSPERQNTTKRAYRDRVAMPTLSLDPFVVPVRDDTGMRRVDYMGERVLFRGLEASDDGTWIMFLGPM